MNLFSHRRKQRRHAPRAAGKVLDRLAPDSIPSLEVYERELRNALTNGSSPDFLVAAVASPANRDLVNTWVRATRDTDVAIAKMRKDRSAATNDEVSLAAKREADAQRALAHAVLDAEMSDASPQ
ncbi:MAG TPA: hypothetical protein VKV24_20035 [Casimicrobiaceae bacterium]|nr:hypothetical protein [Casimicrobiaceae bacterium]